MDIIISFAVALFLSVGFMSGMFFIGKRMGRYDVIDVGWGFVFIVIAVGSMLFHAAVNQTGISWASLLVVSAVAVWGARLATHIAHRVAKTAEEDPRYTAIRSSWRVNNDTAVYWRLFIFQAVLATLVALPVLLITTSPTVVVPEFVIAGLVVWLVGFVIEAVADLQLEVHIDRSPGTLMSRGLWRYSRHPNYFGELMQWWGIGVMALSVDFGWVGLIGPLLLTFLILFVSGIPPAEKRMARKHGWGDYKKRTSVLMPMPPAR